MDSGLVQSFRRLWVAPSYPWLQNDSLDLHDTHSIGTHQDHIRQIRCIVYAEELCHALAVTLGCKCPNNDDIEGADM